MEVLFVMKYYELTNISNFFKKYFFSLQHGGKLLIMHWSARELHLRFCDSYKRVWKILFVPRHLLWFRILFFIRALISDSVFNLIQRQFEDLLATLHAMHLSASKKSTTLDNTTNMISDCYFVSQISLVELTWKPSWAKQCRLADRYISSTVRHEMVLKRKKTSDKNLV